MTGCRCQQCYSLAEVMIEETGNDHGLLPAPGHGLATVSVVEQLDDPCSGGYDCRCSKCKAAVTALVKRGARGSGHQPWNVRAA